jgi:DNA segregation ATPase FtsK/SpoIIIE, S-DNA-T family
MAKKATGKGFQAEKDEATLLARKERNRIVAGLFTVSFSAYMLFAFISYLFTWYIDQSSLDIPFYKLFIDSDIVVENWSGKIGALLAHRFLYKWFGLPAFSIILIFALIGLKLLNIRLLNLAKTIRWSVLYTVWGSVALGYVFHQSAFVPGGLHGFMVSGWLNALIGKVGNGILLSVILFALLTFSFDGFIGWCKRFIKKLFDFKVRDSKLEKDETTEENTLTKIDEPNVITQEGDEPMDDEEPVIELQKDGSPEIKGNRFTFEIVTKADEEIADTITLHGIDESEDAIEILDNIETVESKLIDDDNEQERQLILDGSSGEIALDIEKLTTEEDEPASKISNKPLPNYDPTLDLSNYKLPAVELLEDYEAGNESVTEEELVSNKNRIVETLSNYKIQIDKIKAIVGPTITLYEIVPAPGVRISKIKNLEDDIALSLSALGIRIIAPIPGRGTIGIEVPNLKPEVVSMRSIISSKKFQESKFELPLALGKTISNETFIIDLTKMPHLLVAGATGQGKSVGLNAILTSMLYKKHPAQLKLVLVDPKKVELTVYQKLERYFLAMLPDAEESIITDTQKVVNTLNSLCVEMDSRYDLLKNASVRNIKEYNAKFTGRQLNPEKGHRFLPYIVVVIDEFADLIMTAGKEVELPIARLAQLARAIGIHLIIATQRPTTNIITGLIKANFPARIAFRVTSMMDSRTILDSPGANQLIGRGDMLISQGSDMVRLQCAFVDTPEIERIMNFIDSQQGYPTPYFLPEYIDENTSDLSEVDLSKRDALFEEAARVIVANQQGSTSLIQRKFSIGYNRAGRIVDQLEAAGIVGPFEGSKARQVMITDEVSLERILSSLNR